jgi:hypothetical protein
MTDRETAPGLAWVPSSCTLPTASRPLRVAEFDGFFARSVRGLERPDPTRLRLALEPGPAAASRAAELAARENGCCSFFSFTLGIDAEGTALEVAVPAERTEVLDALQARAAQSGRPRWDRREEPENGRS